MDWNQSLKKEKWLLGRNKIAHGNIFQNKNCTYDLLLVNIVIQKQTNKQIWNLHPSRKTGKACTHPLYSSAITISESGETQ